MSRLPDGCHRNPSVHHADKQKLGESNKKTLIHFCTDMILHFLMVQFGIQMNENRLFFYKLRTLFPIKLSEVTYINLNIFLN